MKLSIMNLFQQSQTCHRSDKDSKYTSSPKLLTSTKEMQIGKTSESWNGLSHELPNGTPFFPSFFSYPLFISNSQFYGSGMTLIQGCGSNLVDKRLLLCYH